MQKKCLTNSIPIHDKKKKTLSKLSQCNTTNIVLNCKRLNVFPRMGKRQKQDSYHSYPLLYRDCQPVSQARISNRIHADQKERNKIFIFIDDICPHRKSLVIHQWGVGGGLLALQKICCIQSQCINICHISTYQQSIGKQSFKYYS